MSNMYLDVLHQRRPAIRYVSPAICDAIFSSTSFPTLLLDALPTPSSLTGLRFTGSGSSLRLIWDTFPGALCYTVYKVDDATDPFGDYHIIAECITDNEYDPNTDPEFDPDTKVCYLVSVITPLGEQVLSPPICTNTDNDGGEPPPIVDCFTNDTPLPDGETGVPYSVFLTPNGPAQDPVWSISAGTLPCGLTINSATGEIGGDPTAPGDYSFTARLDKAGGQFCEKDYTITITGACCLELLTAITPVQSIGNMCYASEEEVIVAIRGDGIITIIDPVTDVAVDTAVNYGGPADMVYAPNENLVFLSNGAEFKVFDPATLTDLGTIAYPADTQYVTGGCYDETNGKIYWGGFDLFGNLTIISLDPATQTCSNLVADAPPLGDSWIPGWRLTHCTLNNRIYIQVIQNTMSGPLITIRVYDTLGVYIESIANAGTGTNDGGQLFWNAAAARVYLIDDQAVADAPGVVVIDPTDNSVEAEIPIGGETRSMGFFDDCRNFSVMQGNGVLEQFDSSTNTSLCNLDLSSVASYKIQIVTVAALGKMYVPRYVVDGEVAVLQAPSC